MSQLLQTDRATCDRGCLAAL